MVLVLLCAFYAVLVNFNYMAHYWLMSTCCYLHRKYLTKTFYPKAKVYLKLIACQSRLKFSDSANEEGFEETSHFIHWENNDTPLPL